MKVVKITLSLLAVVIIAVAGVFCYYGGFSTVDVKETFEGGETFVYEDVMGDYSQTPTITDKVYYSLLNDYDIQTTKGIGMFFDNPQNVEKSKLRSEVGCLLDSQIDSLTLSRISEKFKIKVLPKSKYLVAEFPFKGSMSGFVGMMKIYPAIMDYMKQNNYQEQPITEIYDVPAKKTIYRIELKSMADLSSLPQ